MSKPLTDADIDLAAKRLMREATVSYVEALRQVVALRQSKTSSYSACDSVSTITSDNADARLDAEARAYAAQHGTSYAEAITQVVTFQTSATSSSYSTPSASPPAMSLDEQVDRAARQHMRINGGSYCEALSFVTIDATASFSEGSGRSAVAALEGQALEIFKAGTHTDTDGGSRIFSVADVQAMAAVYSPSRHEAPLTLGHPIDNKPAYGWVKSLQATADGRLLMKSGQVAQDFAEDVKAGRFKKRSASFYMPNTPGNPVPGTWYLRHVAWLGAMPPAVRGMADANFAGETNGCVTFNDI